MPGLRRLRGAVGGPAVHARARDPAGADRVHHRDRLRRPVRVLHEHVRDARHPRPRARAGHRPGHDPRGPVDLGRHRRRRLAVDRRQPPDPRAAPQRPGQDPAVQQPDLRADQGPGLADLRARQDHQVDAVRGRRSPVQPGRARARRRGLVRGPDDRPRPPAPHRGAARRRHPRGRGAGRDLPELPGVQRRRVRGADREGRQGRQPDPPPGRQADPVRRRRRARRRPGPRRRPGDRRTSPTSARTR